MSKISKVVARQVFDSRGNPTIETEVFVKDISASAICPSGASTGTYEAFEKRDINNKKYLGKSVLKPVEFINKVISNKLKNFNVHQQEKIDNLLIRLDGTKQKKRIGANAILSVSIAVKKLSSKIKKIPIYKNLLINKNFKLPYPLMNIINGGAHANNGLRIQEFMIRPVGASNFKEGLRCGAEVFHALKAIIKQKGLSTAVGDEGGFAPNFSGGTEEALDSIMQAIKDAGYEPGKDVTIALDCAASEFFEDGVYNYAKFEGDSGISRTPSEQTDYLSELIDAYPIDSIEDGMNEEDWEGWKLLTDKIGQKCQLVGDDLFVTNVKFLSRGISEGCGNSILIKVNQIGTLSETLDAIEMAHKAGFTAVVSHRSGETSDNTIADIAVATNAGQIKTGSLSRSDRISKYNQLLRIEEMLGSDSRYGD